MATEAVLAKLASTSEVAVAALERQLAAMFKVTRSSPTQGDGTKFWVYLDVLVEVE
jgi:hypothetical protein